MSREMDHINRCIELKCPEMAECDKVFCDRTKDENWIVKEVRDGG